MSFFSATAESANILTIPYLCEFFDCKVGMVGAWSSQ